MHAHVYVSLILIAGRHNQFVHVTDVYLEAFELVVHVRVSMCRSRYIEWRLVL